MRGPFALLLTSSLMLAGCPGSLLVCGVNWEACGEGFGTGDDDDDGVVRDFSNYDGVEYLNIDWDAEAEADGQFDCQAEFRAQGPTSFADDQNLCPTCDELWTVTLVAEDGVDECLGQGTAIEAPTSYERKIGMRLGENGAFEVFRTAFSVQEPLGDSPNEPLVFAGVGAFQGAEYTWSGIETSLENDNRGYEFYFSGEGNF